MKKSFAFTQIIGALASLEFAPLSQQDYDTFGGAADDAVIAFTSDIPLLAAVSALENAPATILSEGDALAIVVSEQTIEMFGCTEEGEPFCIRLSLSAEAL